MWRVVLVLGVFFFFKQKTAYEMRISDWSSDVCSSDLQRQPAITSHELAQGHAAAEAAVGLVIEDHGDAAGRQRCHHPPAGRRLRGTRKLLHDIVGEDEVEATAEAFEAVALALEPIARPEVRRCSAVTQFLSCHLDQPRRASEAQNGRAAGRGR